MNFVEKEVVHPTVEFLRDSYKVTWKELGEMLSEKMLDKGYEVNLTPANVRNFASGRSAAWWFWPEISKMIFKLWQDERERYKGQDLEQTDLNFAKLFSEDLMQVYGLWYALKKEGSHNASYRKINAIALSLANIVMNEHEEFYGNSFPRVLETQDAEKSEQDVKSDTDTKELERRKELDLQMESWLGKQSTPTDFT
jgi:hypothetical protein